MTQSRRMLVLRAVVEDYIRSQEPVGSTSLTRDHDLGVSSATIRNDMAALEDEGYLIQPHTSAGRVPTEKGYRYFVDRLATVVPLSEAQRRGINSFLSGSVSLKDALQRSARLLSEITGQVAVVASPSLAKATLRHVEMVPVAMTTLLAVVITDTGRVAQHGLTIASMPAVDETNRLSNTVNEQCDGLSLSKSAETVRSIAASAGYESVRGVADALADAFESMALDERANELYMSGTSHLAHSRSLADLAPLFDALEEQVVLMKLMSNLSEETNASGVGVAIGIYGCGLDGPDSAESWAQYNEDGTVTIGVCWGDHGQGADAGALGTAHEALRPLNIAADKIRLVMNDTSKAPVGGPAGGSRSQLVVGNAIRVACETLIEAMKKPGGGFYTYDEMKAEGREVRQYGKWTTPCTSPDENGQGEPFCCYMYGLFMAEVAVDITTGKTAVEKLTMIADIGKVNNRLVTDGQLYGGLAQGIGLALTEDYEDIKKHSTLIGAGLPYIKDVPDDIELIYLENSRKDGPFGASGVGELPLTAPHAAIINAIYQACGARVRHLPARPEKVLAALKK